MTVLGVLGVLRRRAGLVLVSMGVCWLAVSADLLASGALTGGDEDHLGRALLLRFALMFTVGSAVERYAGRFAADGTVMAAGFGLLAAAVVWVDLYSLSWTPAWADPG